MFRIQLLLCKKIVVFVLEVRSLRLEAVGSISYRSFHACQLKHYLWVWLGCAAFLQCIFHFHLSLGTTVKSCYLLPIPPLALRQPLTQKHDVLTKIGVNAFLLIVGTILLAVPMVVKLTIFLILLTLDCIIIAWHFCNNDVIHEIQKSHFLLAIPKSASWLCNPCIRLQVFWQW